VKERRYYPILELKRSPPSVQKPHPPLLIGGSGKRLLSFAAGEADIVGLVGRRTKANAIDPATLTMEATEEKINWIRQAAGDRFDRLEILISPWIIRVTNTHEETEKALQFVYQFLLSQDPDTTLTLDQLRDSPYGLAGSEEYLVEKLIYLREHLGVSYWVFMFGLENAVPIIKRLAGM
jgi:alkanesulfonate monooxygenase SsuD/methylene tetrahydromethanopterin reductase-like flavin-dependent oxidoreductase (luciferase family)